jgi:hypothetical protein
VSQRIASRDGDQVLTKKRGAADRGLQKLKIELFDMKRNSCEGLQMIDIAKARETAKNLHFPTINDPVKPVKRKYTHIVLMNFCKISNWRDRAKCLCGEMRGRFGHWISC